MHIYIYLYHISHLNRVFHELNHSAIGDPPFWKTPYTYPPNHSNTIGMLEAVTRFFLEISKWKKSLETRKCDRRVAEVSV